MTNMKMNTVILLSLAACTGMLACPGAWATAVCQEQSYPPPFPGQSCG